MTLDRFQVRNGTVILSWCLLLCLQFGGIGFSGSLVVQLALDEGAFPEKQGSTFGA